MEKKLREFLEKYRDNPKETDKPKKNIVDQYAIDGLVFFAVADGLEEEIINYGTAHPEASFWDLLKIGLEEFL